MLNNELMLSNPFDVATIICPWMHKSSLLPIHLFSPSLLTLTYFSILDLYHNFYYHLHLFYLITPLSVSWSLDLDKHHYCEPKPSSFFSLYPSLPHNLSLHFFLILVAHLSLTCPSPVPHLSLTCPLLVTHLYLFVPHLFLTCSSLVPFLSL